MRNVCGPRVKCLSEKETRLEPKGISGEKSQQS